MRKLIYQHVSAVDPSNEVQLIIYYTKFKTQQLLLNNNPSRNRNKTSETNVVYQFTCNSGKCISHNNSYIGHTTTSLSRRLTCHLSGQQSAILSHLRGHGPLDLPLRKVLVDNTCILYRNSDVKRLMIMEALLIKTKSSTLNRINFTQGENVLLIFNN